MLSFQYRVSRWMQACFGPEIANDKKERIYRFIEEALELAQAMDVTPEEINQLIKYTYDRPKGEVEQEIGGVCVTLNALANALNGREASAPVSIEYCQEREIERCWQNIDKIREKHKKKPKNSPLPEMPVQAFPIGCVDSKLCAVRKQCTHPAKCPHGIKLPQAIQAEINSAIHSRF